MSDLNKDWKKTRKIYWSDEKHDDFNDLGNVRPDVPKGYKYKRTNVFFCIWAWALYHIIAVPILWVGMFFKGIRVEGRSHLRNVKGSGAFVYGNHVAYSDVTKYQTIVFPFRTVNILGYSDSLAIPVVKHLVRALGYLPLPLKGDLDNLIALNDAFKFYTLKRKQLVLIFPEAHIWPYYTKIREFGYGSFAYPASINVPVIPTTTVWRKSKFSKRPLQTIIIGEPIFPKANYDANQNKIYLHDECLKSMRNMANSRKQYEYIEYIYVENSEKKGGIF